MLWFCWSTAFIDMYIICTKLVKLEYQAAWNSSSFIVINTAEKHVKCLSNEMWKLQCFSWEWKNFWRRNTCIRKCNDVMIKLFFHVYTQMVSPQPSRFYIRYLVYSRPFRTISYYFHVSSQMCSNKNVFHVYMYKTDDILFFLNISRSAFMCLACYCVCFGNGIQWPCISIIQLAISCIHCSSITHDLVIILNNFGFPFSVCVLWIFTGASII